MWCPPSGNVWTSSAWPLQGMVFSMGTDDSQGAQGAACFRKRDLCGPPKSPPAICAWESCLYCLLALYFLPSRLLATSGGELRVGTAQGFAQALECTEQCASIPGYAWLGPTVKLVYMPGVHIGSVVGVQKGRRSSELRERMRGESQPQKDSYVVHLGKEMEPWRCFLGHPQSPTGLESLRLRDHWKHSGIFLGGWTLKSPQIAS